MVTLNKIKEIVGNRKLYNLNNTELLNCARIAMIEPAIQFKWKRIFKSVEEISILDKFAHLGWQRHSVMDVIQSLYDYEWLFYNAIDELDSHGFIEN